MNKRQFIVAGVAAALGTITNVYLSTLLHLILQTKSLRFLDSGLPNLQDCIVSIVSVKAHLMLFLCLEGFIFLFAVFLIFSNNKPYQSRMMQITPEISTPVATGQKQYGSARWLTGTEKKKIFSVVSLDRKDINSFSAKLQEGGIVLGMQQRGKKSEITYVGEDTHVLCLGATRSGKTRSVILQSIGFIGLTGESMVLSDPKGELYNYTAPYLERLGYKVYAVDFKNPFKSQRYSFLQRIIEGVDNGDIASAVDATWDLTSTLVGEAKGERIWNDGEASSIAAAIMSVVYDNREPERHKYRNMTNVYYFISEMCSAINGKMPIVEYVKGLPDSHPAKGLIAVSKIAPSKTRGSFYTAALMTLKLFTNPNIYAMTQGQDFNPAEIGTEKTALFIILPDEKKTYHSLAGLMVAQIYEELVRVADARGGRLKRRVDFILEEFGNFIKIPSLDSAFTAGGGRGIRYSIFLQSIAQLEDKYGREVARILRGNCETWIYLQADDNESLKEISEKLGKYTVSSHSVSSSSGRYSSSSTSESVNLIGRDLLTPDEVGRINRPYSLVTSRSYPAIMVTPDISQTIFNGMFGLGDKEHNRMVREQRENQRPHRITEMNDIELWGIWKKYQYICSRPDHGPMSSMGFNMPIPE